PLRGVPEMGCQPSRNGVKPRQLALCRAPRHHLVQPGTPGDGDAPAGQASPGDMDYRLELRGLGGGVGAGSLVPSPQVTPHESRTPQANHRATAVAVLQCRRSAGSAVYTDPLVPLWARLPPGMD